MTSHFLEIEALLIAMLVPSRPSNLPPRLLPCRSCLALAALLGVALMPQPASAQRAGEEITFPPESFKKLDAFEALNLDDADKLYLKLDFMGAHAAYKAYSFEFAQSQALPYVLLRLGRCLHQLDKRNAAIKAYQDVVDYFPDDVRYAAAALFYIGQCHGQNGDDAKQTAVWARMVKDDDYVAQPNSGSALTYLGEAMQKLGKFDEAAEYQWRTAVAFLQSNPNAADAARRAVVAHYVSRRPNHDKLKEFYVAASGFDGRGVNVGNPEEDARYWSTALDQALKTEPGEPLEQACSYWAAKMGERFAENDDLRKVLFDVQLAHEKDPAGWVARMDKQFKSKPGTIDRVLQWCGYFARKDELRPAFFERESKALLASLKNEEKIQVMHRLRHPLQMHAEAQQVMRLVNTQGMSDEELVKYADFLAEYESEDEVLRYFARMKDPLLATKARFDYYNRRSHRNPPNMEKALAQIPELKKSPKYAGVDLVWSEGILLQGLGRHEEAIKAFRAANKQPDSTWEISNSLVALKQYAEAIKTVTELYSLGGGVASNAALRVADIYRTAGDKGKEVDQLRQVLRQYPKSTESSEAHRRLEAYGVALIGGEAEATE